MDPQPSLSQSYHKLCKPPNLAERGKFGGGPGELGAHGDGVVELHAPTTSPPPNFFFFSFFSVLGLQPHIELLLLFLCCLLLIAVTSTNKTNIGKGAPLPAFFFTPTLQPYLTMTSAPNTIRMKNFFS